MDTNGNTHTCSFIDISRERFTASRTMRQHGEHLFRGLFLVKNDSMISGYLFWKEEELSLAGGRVAAPLLVLTLC